MKVMAKFDQARQISADNPAMLMIAVESLSDLGALKSLGAGTQSSIDDIVRHVRDDRESRVDAAVAVTTLAFAAESVVAAVTGQVGPQVELHDRESVLVYMLEKGLTL